MGHANREESRHGPRRCRLPGQVPDPGPGREVPALFDAVLMNAGVDVVLTKVRVPRMNSIMERWVQTCRRELLDRTLIWNQRHLLHALREFEDFYNSHRPHQSIANTRPTRPPPTPRTDPEQITRLNIRKRDRLGRIFHEHRHAAGPGRMRFSAGAVSCSVLRFHQATLYACWTLLPSSARSDSASDEPNPS
ncbi:integrase core domain-containing protein [Streptomyces sp. NPDC002671]